MRCPDEDGHAGFRRRRLFCYLVDGREAILSCELAVGDEVLGKLASDPLPEFSFRWLAQVQCLLDGLGPHARSPAARLILEQPAARRPSTVVITAICSRAHAIAPRASGKRASAQVDGRPTPGDGLQAADAERSDVGVDCVAHLLVETEAKDR